MLTTLAPRRQLNIAVQETRVANARVMANASVWSMDTNTPVDIDTFALIIAVATHARPDVAFNHWTQADMLFVQASMPAYCHEINTFVPDDFAEQLEFFVCFLRETGWLATPKPVTVTSAETSPVDVSRPSLTLVDA